MYTTAAMAEILLSQDMLRDAEAVIATLEKEHPGDQRVQLLRQRLNDRQGGGEPVQRPEEPMGTDRLTMALDRTQLQVSWELSDDGLALARRQVRYSGQTILRLFIAQPGPRGVRTLTRDFDLAHHCGSCTFSGMPALAAFTAAIGFLGRNGHFVPMARAVPVVAVP
jgi:hypothetical protein